MSGQMIGGGLQPAETRSLLNYGLYFHGIPQPQLLRGLLQRDTKTKDGWTAAIVRDDWEHWKGLGRYSNQENEHES